MMNFPDAPSVGQVHAVAGKPTYKWDGARWKTTALQSGALPSATLPQMDLAASPGTEVAWSRGDHSHPIDTSRVPVANPTFTGTLTTAALSVTGNLNVTGTVRTMADGNLIGWHVGTTGMNWSSIDQSETNIIFYDYGSNNWAGIGSDQSGFIFFRTGGGGSNNVAAMYASTTEVNFVGAPYAPTPANGTNSNVVATTAYVIANHPQGGPYLPLSGGTLTGTLTVTYGHIMPYRNGATGVCYLSYNDYYIYYDGGNYVFGGSGIVNSAAGRIWGSNDWTRPVTSARIGPHAGDQFLLGGSAYGTPHTGLTESYAGAVATGSTGGQYYTNGTDWGQTTRFRYSQIYVEGTWYSAGYA